MSSLPRAQTSVSSLLRRRVERVFAVAAWPAYPDAVKFLGSEIST